MSQNAKRLAVVIGNSDYEHLTSLPNASSDAKAINKKLLSLGYKVTLGINKQRNEILEIFTNIQKSWEHEAEEIVFYYSGHGISINGKAYIAPVDTNISSDFLKESYLSVEKIVKTLLKHRRINNYPIIIILDCCRSEVISDSKHPKRPFQNIEGKFGKKSNIAILYSTACGKTASDGGDEIKNSPYTNILLKNIDKDLTIYEINAEITNTLSKIYGQVSWMSQCLHEPYRFKLPGSRELPQTPSIPNDAVVLPFYGVPLRNYNYVNRPKIISKMRALLSDKPSIDGGNISNILALNGLGGMGKTQLMLQYCYLYRQEYNYTFWLEADGQMESFRNLGYNLGLDKAVIEERYKDGNIIDFVCSWLQKKTKWLLLLNNVDEEVTKLLNHLPRIGGDIILTTREPIPSAMSKVISVPKMDENEALSLLLNLKEQEFGSINPQKMGYCKKIVAELDYMPLAISLACAYMKNTRKSPKNYLNVLKNQRGKLFKHVNQDNSQYSHTLATVWKLSFKRIQDLNPLARFILDICAFLQPDVIPVSFFEKQFISLNDGSVLPFSSSGLEDNPVRTAIAVLEKFSFVTIISKEEEEEEEEDFLSIHRLFQESIFNGMNDEQKIRLAYNISKAFNDETKFEDPYAATTQKIMNTYLSHIQHFILLLDKLNENPLLSANLEDLLIRTVDYLQKNKIYIDAEKLVNLALSLSKSLHGENSLPMAQSLIHLARQSQNRGIYSDAEPLYQRALKITEAILGPDHLGMATPLYNLASLYYDQSKYADSESLHEKALKIRIEVLGEEHQDTAQSTNDIALVHDIQGDYATAELYGKRAIKIYEKIYGSQHPQLVIPLNNLATFYSNQSKYDEAKEVYEKALSITKGQKNLYTAITMVNLESLYYNTGKYAEAERMCKEALKINEIILGDHPDTATSLNNLAGYHKIQGDYIKAESLHKKALEIVEKALGPEHRTTATFQNDLASLYKCQGKYNEAKSRYQRALGIREKILGSGHQDTIITLYHIASLCGKQGDYDDAEKKYNQALKFRDALSEHLIMGTILNGLATLYFNQGKFSPATPLFQGALKIYEKIYGSEHQFITIVLDNLTRLYSIQGKYADAKQLCRRSLTIKEKTLGLEHPDTIESQNELESLNRKLTPFRRWTDPVVKTVQLFKINRSMTV